jgi:hypothetical protein
VKRIGVIVAGSAYPLDGFKSGLQSFGWIEGDAVTSPKGHEPTFTVRGPTLSEAAVC